ncbi:hypothetical protein FIBSPDRAFT_1006874 [Athelia psychrophila]|uniref:Uncharacterized protein n=1 Tax=Athelia psychrophila TaxID=1759441 RepID=A0A167VHV3_9AGAM|nr:hypothetical protein FIBSPDRAFT_1006874 [Fibularhizoctonia sp. CBS 109695]
MAGTWVPVNWPAHFETAIMILNNRQMPLLQCSLAELMFGLIINTTPTPTDTMTSTHTIEHMEHPKLMFDKHVMARAPQVITFLPGQLVQVHCSDVWYTMASIHKLIPMWSFPWHVVSQDRNLNILETAGRPSGVGCRDGRDKGPEDAKADGVDDEDTGLDIPDNIDGGNIDEQTEEEVMAVAGKREDNEDELRLKEMIVGGYI